MLLVRNRYPVSRIEKGKDFLPDIFGAVLRVEMHGFELPIAELERNIEIDVIDLSVALKRESNLWDVVALVCVLP
jgi:hypothetical protein